MSDLLQKLELAREEARRAAENVQKAAIAAQPELVKSFKKTLTALGVTLKELAGTAYDTKAMLESEDVKALLEPFMPATKKGKRKSSGGGKFDLEKAKALLAGAKEISVIEWANSLGVSVQTCNNNIKNHPEIFKTRKEDPKNLRSTVYVSLKK